MSRPALTRMRGAGSADPPEPPTGSEITAVVLRRTRLAFRLRLRLRFRLRRLRRSSWRWKAGVPLLLVALLAAGCWFVWSGPVLVLHQVTVRGVPAAEADEVRSAARLPAGRPMVRLDLAAAQRRVAAIRTVRSVEVSRSWPTTVTITVTPRTPVAVVKDAQGQLHLADSSGTAYAEVPSAPPEVPLVDADASDPAAVQSVVQVLASLPARVRAQVTSAQAKGPDAVTLAMGSVTVLWGDPRDSALKSTVLQALRRANPAAHRFDLSAPRSPSVG